MLDGAPVEVPRGRHYEVARFCFAIQLGRRQSFDYGRRDAFRSLSHHQFRSSRDFVRDRNHLKPQLMAEKVAHTSIILEGLYSRYSQSEFNYPVPERPAICVADDYTNGSRTVGVIICDTYSRPFRNGIVEFALGVSGVKPFKDYRGMRDLFGHQLRFKVVAVADEIAAAAELVMGQGAEGIPAAIVKGLTATELDCEAKSSDLVMPASRDLYRGAI